MIVAFVLLCLASVYSIYIVAGQSMELAPFVLWNGIAWIIWGSLLAGKLIWGNS